VWIKVVGPGVMYGEGDKLEGSRGWCGAWEKIINVFDAHLHKINIIYSNIHMYDSFYKGRFGKSKNNFGRVVILEK
jgi:hypothetical protein